MPKPKQPVTKALVIAARVEPEDYAAFKAAAEADRRTISSLAGKILLEWLDNHGRVAPAAKVTPLRRQTRRA